MDSEAGQTGLYDRTSGVERLSNPSSLRHTTHRSSVRDVALSTFLCIRLLALLSLAALAQVYGGTPARPATPWAAVSKEVTEHLLPRGGQKHTTHCSRSRIAAPDKEHHTHLAPHGRAYAAWYESTRPIYPRPSALSNADSSPLRTICCIQRAF